MNIEKLRQILTEANRNSRLAVMKYGGKHSEYMPLAIHQAYQAQDPDNLRDHAAGIVRDAFNIIKNTGSLTPDDVSAVAFVDDMEHCRNIKRAILRAIEGAIQIKGKLKDINTYGVNQALSRAYGENIAA